MRQSKLEKQWSDLATNYNVSAKEYFTVLRLAILHVDGVWEESSYKVANYDKSDEVYKFAIEIIKLWGGEKDV